MIRTARANGERYVGRYIDFTAAEVAKRHNCDNDDALRHRVYEIFNEPEFQRSLVDCIKLSK